jgi:hypothetical protein
MWNLLAPGDAQRCSPDGAGAKSGTAVRRGCPGLRDGEEAVTQSGLRLLLRDSNLRNA